MNHPITEYETLSVEQRDKIVIISSPNVLLAVTDGKAFVHSWKSAAPNLTDCKD
jgi:hypothetical protein